MFMSKSTTLVYGHHTQEVSTQTLTLSECRVKVAQASPMSPCTSSELYTSEITWPPLPS